MAAERKIATFGSIAVALFLVGCAHYTQTTSGMNYLAAFPEAMKSDDESFEAKLRAAADVEPLLRFPARIGLARIGHDNCRPTLVSPSVDEGKTWLELADSLGPDYGEFVPISPLVAAMVAPTPPACWDSDATRDIVGTVRLAAARQHLDVVMIYEVDATANARRNPLSIANWTVIGAFVVPSQNLKAQGVAQAMLVDVRNGYPYGTIQATADDKAMSALVRSWEAEKDLAKRVETAAVQNLAHEARDMMRELKQELAAPD